jgi:predicted phosphohydrolase
MKVFAIGDLHLSGGTDKPMDVFGPAWQNHGERIANAWMDSVSQEDVVLLPGDFYWAHAVKPGEGGYGRLAALPGTKLIIRGNHDYWWNSSHRSGSVASFSLRCRTIASPFAIACRRYTGWICPGSAVFSTDDQKIYDREVLRLGLSLSALPSGGRRIAMLHYPPFNENRAPSGFTEQLERAGVELVVYGHLHGRSCRGGFEGVRNGVEYRLVSADHIEFKPKLILEL